MNLISPVGERLWAGELGHGLVVFTFACAVSGACFFFKKKISGEIVSALKKVFLLHFISSWLVFTLLVYMLCSRFFEYQYVWQHSNRSMDLQFVLSSLWEGQEGSFLLWICWNALTGWLYFQFSKENKEIRARTLSLIMMVQAFLISMILGIYIGDYRVGSSPFLLLKQHPDFMNLPFLMNEDYLKNLDGRGLNPLLMNYWMVIHPPVLFLGFSLTLFPFAQILSRLMQGFEEKWHRHVLPGIWLGVAVLGAGILMGGAWAYESLSFGGFWAWDPVENSSLVPWLMLVAGGHQLVIDKNRNRGFLSGILISSLAFIFVLYSTFLTRSGILGNASVHSFTDLGMQGQLLAYLFFFIFLLVFFLIPDDNQILRWIFFFAVLYGWFFSFLYEKPIVGILTFLMAIIFGCVVSGIYYNRKSDIQEPTLFSREFSMYLGVVILFFLSLLIIFFTSLPVINKLSGTRYAMPSIRDYNRTVMPFTVLVLLIMGLAQWLRYKQTHVETVFKKIRIPLLVSLGISLVSGIPLFFISQTDNFTLYEKSLFFLLLFSSVFAIVSNVLSGKQLMIRKFISSGSYVTHAGFALLVLGALIATSKKAIISRNYTSTDLKQLGKNYDNQTASLLIQNDTVPMGPYYVTYKKKTRKGMNVYFAVEFLEKKRDNTYQSLFTLQPRVQDNPVMGKASDPDTRHFAGFDVYTYVSYADLSSEEEQKSRGFGDAKNYIAHLKDSIVLENTILVPDTLFYSKFTKAKDTIIRVYMGMIAYNSAGKTHTITPYFEIKNQSIFSDFVTDSIAGIMINFWKINPENATFEFIIKEDLSRKKDFIVLEAHVFPAINLLWSGCILMVLGTIMVVVQKVRQS